MGSRLPQVDWRPLQRIIACFGASLWPLGSRAEGSATQAWRSERRAGIEPKIARARDPKHSVCVCVNSVCVCVFVCQTLLLRAKNVVRCSVLCFLRKQGAAGLSLTLRPTKTVIDRCVNVPARDAPGRNGRSWVSHESTFKFMYQCWFIRTLGT